MNNIIVVCGCSYCFNILYRTCMKCHDAAAAAVMVVVVDVVVVVVVVVACCLYVSLRRLT